MVHGNFSTKIWASGKIVGEVKNGVFVKKVRASKHMLRSPRGWALDIQSLKDAEQAGARFVELRDSDTGKTYRASIEQIWNDGFQINRGFGAQQVMVMSKWNREEPEVKQLSFTI